MMMNIAVAVVILALGYLWLTRGSFSAFLHLACTIVAGAIAFAAWEPLGYMLVGVLPSTGWLAFLQGATWAIALLVPFAVSLVILRVIVDQIVRANMQLPGALEPAIAGVFGLCAGLLTVGIGVIGLSNARVSTTFGGYKPMYYTEDKQAGAGSLVLSDSLWIPADKLTAALYRHTSTHSFSAPSESLAKWYPNLHAAGYVNRISPDNGGGRNTATPDDFSLFKRYTVGDSSTPSAELLEDRWRTQKYLDIHGEPVASGQIHGFVLKFEAGAKEAGETGPGPVVLSNGQVRLVARNDDGESIDIFPLALIGQGDIESGQARQYGRFVYDAADVYIASVGAGDPTMAVEFLVPAGYEPIGFFFRGVRVELADGPEPTAYANTNARDRLVPGGELITGGRPKLVLDRTGAQVFDGPAELDDRENESGLMRTNQFGGVVNVQNLRRYFRISENDNLLLDGQGTYDADFFSRRNAPRERQLRADKFGTASDQVMFQIDVSVGKAGTLVSGIPAEMGADEPLRLVTASGESFEALGYVYVDRKKTEIRFTPSDPLTGMGELPSLSTSDPDRELRVLFVVSRGVQIEAFAIGDRAVLLFDPPAPADKD